MAMTQYPDNQKIYINGVRQKSFEHGYKLLPSYLYPTRIKGHEESLASWQQFLAECPGSDLARRRIASTKAAITRAKKEYERALAWDKRRDELEARGEFF